MLGKCPHGYFSIPGLQDVSLQVEWNEEFDLVPEPQNRMNGSSWIWRSYVSFRGSDEPKNGSWRLIVERAHPDGVKPPSGIERAESQKPSVINPRNRSRSQWAMVHVLGRKATPAQLIRKKQCIHQRRLYRGQFVPWHGGTG
jgi:hypothetical protein